MLNKTLIAVLALFLACSAHAQKWDDANEQVLSYLGNGDYANALMAAKQARKIAQQEFGENNADYSASLHNLASAHKKLGEYTAAEALYWEALKIDKQVLGAKHQNYAFSLFGLANLYKLKKEYAKAESIYLDALDIMKKAVTDEHPDYAIILSDYADLHTGLGNFFNAEKNLKKSKDIMKYTVGDKHQDYASVLFNFGKLEKTRGDIPKAKENLTRALGIFKKKLGENHPDYKDCKRYLDNLSNPTYQLYKPAITELQSNTVIERPALNVSPSIPNKEEMVKEEMPKMPEMQEMQETETPEAATASEMVKTEVVVETETTSPIQPRTEASNMTEVMTETDGSKGATEQPTMETKVVEVPVETKVVEVPVETEPAVMTPAPAPTPPKPKTWSDYSIMMDRYTQKGDYMGAVEVGEKALKMVKDEFGMEHENYTWISLKLADSYDNAGLLEKAIPLYEQDLESVERAMGKNNKTYTKRRDELLAAYNATGQKGKAHQFYKKSVYASFAKFNDSSLLEQNRMMEKMQMEIEQYYTKSLELGFLVGGTEMQNFNLSFKGRGTDAALGIENTMTGEIATYQNQLRNKLKSNEAAVDFLRMKNEKTNVGNYYALITRKNSAATVLVPLLSENKIEVLINAKADSPDSYIQSADRSYQLYQLVWEPLEEHLRGVNFVHVSTVGVLNKVAFSGLMDVKKNSLADKYEIYYYSSLRDFINDKKTFAKNESVTFFGGANFGKGSNSQLDYMPATKDEVNTFKVVCAAKGWKVETNTGADASEEKLKNLSGENAPGVLHLATPVYFQHLEEFSGIALSNANAKINAAKFSEDTNDGLLNAREIAKLDLSKTNLVLLSTSETGADKNSDKGILSIQRALKNAGVNTILFSQWKVPDKQTQEMLALFYFNHLSGMDTHKAFYAAQNDIRKLYSSPYYWAGFILIE